jgi:hypothetical protein
LANSGSGSLKGHAVLTALLIMLREGATDRHARRSNRHAPRSCPSGTDRHAAARPIPPGRWRERNGSSHALVSRRGSALASGCRCAEGGTPDPCPRDHLARPGVKVERPQAASSSPGPSQLAGAGGGRTNDLDPRRLSGRVVFPPGEGIGRTRLGAGSQPRRGRFRPLDPPRHAIAPFNSKRPSKRLYSDFPALWTSPDRSPNHPTDPSPDGSPNPSPEGSLRG